MDNTTCTDTNHRIINHETDLQFAGPFFKDEYGDQVPSVALVEGVAYTYGEAHGWTSPDGKLSLYVEGDDDWDLWYAEVCPTGGHTCSY